MPIQKLRQFLDENLVKYIVITHSKAYTSQGIAAMCSYLGKRTGQNRHAEERWRTLHGRPACVKAGKSCSLRQAHQQ